MVYILIYIYTLYNNVKLILFICITNLRYVYGLLLIFGVLIIVVVVVVVVVVVGFLTHIPYNNILRTA